MNRFFADVSDIYEEDHILYLRSEDTGHIKNVLRMKVGDELVAVEAVGSKDMTDALSAGPEEKNQPREFSCRIEELTGERVRCRICFVKEADSELPSKVYIFQGLPKADKMELIIQKCIELGAYEIIPVKCARSVVKLGADKAEKKVSRWNQIAKGAAEQSRRAFIPRVTLPMDMREAVKYAKEVSALKLVPYELFGADAMEETREIMKSLRPGEDIAVFIGPEGGFEEGEIALCKESGIRPITLGRRILRTETAGMTVMSWIMLFLE